MLKKILLLPLVCLFFYNIQAQEAVISAGGDASSTSGSVSYSVGQVFYNTNTSADNSVAEGVQQPYEISIVTKVNNAEYINLSAIAYPNPTTDYLQLEIDATEDYQSFTYQLFDISGKMIQSQAIESSTTKVNMKNLSSATYFVKVLADDKELKTFKIIKK